MTSSMRPQGDKELKTLLLTMTMILALTVAPSQAEDFDADQKSQIKQLALEALLENPEIIEQAYQRLQELRQAQQAAATIQFIISRREDFEQDVNAPVLGNPNGDVTVVEFFDYNCPYCKRAADVVDELIANDQKVRLVYREWPILNEGSVFAARAALASREQEKYAQMHKALMSAPRVDETVTLKIAADLGLNLDKLRADMQKPEVEAHIRLSMDLARGLNINGTPTFVVGEVVAPGLVPLDQLNGLVGQARGSSTDD